MTLKVAFQMDPMEGLNIAGDSTFALMLSAQARGYTNYHYTADELNYSDGRVWVTARPVTVQREAGNHFTFGAPVKIDLADNIDAVLMRQDPPFDLGYITATHLLERITHRTLVANDPVSVRNAPEKVFVLDFAQFMPPTLVTRSLDEVRAFHKMHGEIVVKPLHGNAGSAVMHIGKDGKNLAAITELFGRIPGAGEIRSNLAAGGRAEATDLTQGEREICAAIGPELKKRGLLFVGIDVIGGKWLTEINVTSPTGIVAIDAFNGTDTPALIWDTIEAKLSK